MFLKRSSKESGLKLFNISLILSMRFSIFCVRSSRFTAMEYIISFKIGAASSAAADGVGALMSAAKSERAQSISWPTAEMTGVLQAAIALTRSSSENGRRSSKEPPPLPIMIRSPKFFSSAIFNCLIKTGAASSP